MKDRIVAEIDVNQLKTNIDSVKSLIGNRPLYATVKANAYGHGIIEISRLFEKFGVDTLCVASFEEAIQIRNENINANILVLAPIYADEDIIKEGIENKISFCVCSVELVDAISKAACQIGKEALVHIKVDTGMSRVGVQVKDAVEFIRYTKNKNNIKCVGVFTHLAAGDDINERDFTINQISTMKSIKKEINDDSIIFHTANSAGILKYPEAYMDAVRGGIVIYGYPAYNTDLPIKPILKLKSHIIFIKTLPKGLSISYNRTFVTERETRVATISCGYGDGYFRALSNKGYVYINGQKAKILGRICMDQLIVDVTDIKAELYDDVMLYDHNFKETHIEYLAKELGTISYEILTNIAARVKREYIN